MNIQVAILAAIALTAALKIHDHKPYVSSDWLTRMSSIEHLCATGDLEMGCLPFVEHSRWSRPRQSAQN
jgi:hypothetical protein